jgi:hypothetical protein
MCEKNLVLSCIKLKSVVIEISGEENIKRRGNNSFVLYAED